MILETCPHCNVRVVPSANGSCPSCRQLIQRLPEEERTGADPISSSEVNPYQSPISNEIEADPLDQQKLVARGGKIFWAIVGINISPMIWAILSNQPMANPGLGTFLNLALLYFLWRGQPWAKWFTMVLFVPISILLLIIGIFSANFLCIAFGGFIALVPLLLIFSKSLNAFLVNQRWSIA